MNFFSKAWAKASETAKSAVAEIAQESVDSLNKIQEKYQKTKAAIKNQAVEIAEKVKETVAYTKQKIIEGAEFTKQKLVQGAELIKQEAIKAKEYTVAKINSLFEKAKEIASNVKNFITTTCPLLYKKGLASAIDKAFALTDSKEKEVKPKKKEDPPKYPTVSNPDLDKTGKSKQERYNERLNKIKSAKSLNNPALQNAIDRLELNNIAVERAKLAEHCYNQDPDYVPDGWKPVSHDSLPKDLRDQVWQDDSSGFKAEIYINTFEPPQPPKKGEEKYVIAFQGTANKGGVKDDLKQGLGLPSKQYEQAGRLADAIKTNYGTDRIEFTGHSLGGGLASGASMLTGSKANTFNGAGLHPNTVADSGLTKEYIEKNKNQVQAFSSTRDPLNTAQDNRNVVKAGLVGLASLVPIIGPGLAVGISGVLLADFDSLPKAVGERHIITPPFPNNYDDKNALGKLKEGHGMPSLIAGIEQQKAEDLATIDRVITKK